MDFKSLPNEIIFQILSHFRLNTPAQKLKLITTCFPLMNLTPIVNPFSVITICNERKFKTFESLSEQDRNQVEKLSLHGRCAEMTHVATLPHRIPNLNVFDLSDGNSTPQEYVIDDQIARLWKWVTEYREDTVYSLYLWLLTHGGFCNLIKLDVTARQGSSDCHVLIENLLKAPKLKELRLSGFGMSLRDLQLLRKNAPRLETLRLSYVQSLETEGEPVVGEPSSCSELTELILNGTDLTPSLMEYMGEQYRKLKKLTTDFKCDKPELNRMLSGFSHLEYLDCETEITTDLLGAIDTSGAQLKEININGNNSNQLKLLADSNQGRYLETIVIRHSICGSMTLDDIKNFKNLKHLTTPDDITIDGILKELKHLETLELSGDISLDDEKDDDFKSNLKTLRVGKKISDKLQLFLLKVCPELS